MEIKTTGTASDESVVKVATFPFLEHLEHICGFIQIQLRKTNC